MMKYLILSLVVACLTACSGHDEHYFLVNPKALNEALEKCPNDHPYNITCTQLDAIAEDVNKLSYALQSNPQEFGQQILLLQTQLADLNAKLRTKMHQPDVEATIKSVTLQLDMRLAIVKWLESPEK
jgi:hypothetical protein